MARIKIEDLPRGMEVTRKELAVITGGGLPFQAAVVDALNSSVDAQNMDLLDDVIGAANEVADMNGAGSITFGGGSGLPRWRFVSANWSK